MYNPTREEIEAVCRDIRFENELMEIDPIDPDFDSRFKPKPERVCRMSSEVSETFDHCKELFGEESELDDFIDAMSDCSDYKERWCRILKARWSKEMGQPKRSFSLD